MSLKARGGLALILHERLKERLGLGLDKVSQYEAAQYEIP
jgi:hypothetical protein